MVRGDVLQIVVFSVLFALAVAAVSEKGRPIVRAMGSLAQVMFKFTNYVMMFAPIGVGAAMAHTVASQGLGVSHQSREINFVALHRACRFRRNRFGLSLVLAKFRGANLRARCASGNARLRHHQ